MERRIPLRLLRKPDVRTFFMDVALLGRPVTVPVLDDEMWDGILALTEFHKVQGAVAGKLSHPALLSGVPGFVRDTLAVEKRLIGMNARLVASTAGRLQTEADRIGVKIAFVKGAALLCCPEHEAYVPRTCEDVDVIVSHRDAAHYVKTLSASGFTADSTLSDQFSTVLRQGGSPILVDLHGSIASWRYPAVDSRLLAGDIPVIQGDLDGVSLSIAAPHVHLLHLLLHGGVHHFFRRLYLMNDVAALLASGAAVDWSAFAAVARQLRVLSQAEICLCVVQRWFPRLSVALPPAARSRARMARVGFWASLLFPAKALLAGTPWQASFARSLHRRGMSLA